MDFNMNLLEIKEKYPFVYAEVKTIPKCLHSIFIPATEDGLQEYEKNIIAWKQKSKSRRAAFDLWRSWKLALNRRKLNLHYLSINIRLKQFKKDMKTPPKQSDEIDGTNYA
jgi:hypothetical protein